jgi:Carboxypeptidase regulatory-like domain
MRGLCLLVVFSLLLVVSVCSATIFGTVRGVVHDPQHRPVADVQVVLKARASAFTLTTQSDVNGEFHFDAVPVAEYTITVSKSGFATEEQAATVLSGTAPILHFELQLSPRDSRSQGHRRYVGRREYRPTGSCQLCGSRMNIARKSPTCLVPTAYFTSANVLLLMFFAFS